VRERRYYTFLISGYGVFALLLVATGLVGLFTYSVKQRSAEIGLRMALGAAPGSILRLIFARSFSLALTGAVLGTAASMGLNQFLAGQLYQISAIDPLTYLSCIAAMLLLVGVATYLPAKHALSVDPASSLRQE
jgi:putative ABC transport system permease protein